MDPRLQEMLDHYEINKTMAEYCHACDRCDEVNMAAVYCEESWDQHGTVNADGKEFSKIITERAKEHTKTLSHVLGQSMVKIQDDRAGAETYFICVMETEENGRRICNQMGGRYVDRLAKVDGRWLLKHREVVRDWSFTMPIERDWWDGSGMTEGERSNRDVSYAVLGLTHGQVV